MLEALVEKEFAVPATASSKLVAEAYRMISTAGPCNEADVAGELGTIDLDTAKEIVAGLLELGLVARSYSESDKVFASPVHVGLPAALSATLARASQHFELLSQLAPHFQPVYQMPTHSADNQQAIGIDSLIATITLLEAESKETIDSVVPRVPPPKALETALQFDQPILERGIRCRAVYPEQARAARHAVEYAKAVAPFGQHIRTHMLATQRILIFDRRVAILSGSYRTGEPAEIDFQVISDPDITRVLVDLFELLWSGGDDILNPSGGITNRQRSLLRGLAQGYPDDAIAKSLGVSRKTVGRMIQELSNQVSVNGRFALGVAAIQRGWI